MSATSANIEIGRCPSCNETIYQNQPVYWCQKCHRPLPEEIDAKRVKVPSAQPALGTDDFAIQVLRIFAWLNLAGMAVGIYLLIAAAEASAKTASNNIVTGITLIIASFFGWSFLLVVCSIAESLVTIRRNMERTSFSPASPTSSQSPETELNQN